MSRAVILLADDNSSWRSAFERGLKRRFPNQEFDEVEFLHCDGLQTGHRLIQERGPEITHVVSDMDMKETLLHADGFYLYRELEKVRGEKAKEMPPFVMVSTSPTPRLIAPFVVGRNQKFTSFRKPRYSEHSTQDVFVEHVAEKLFALARQTGRGSFSR